MSYVVKYEWPHSGIICEKVGVFECIQFFRKTARVLSFCGTIWCSCSIPLPEPVFRNASHLWRLVLLLSWPLYMLRVAISIEKITIIIVPSNQLHKMQTVPVPGTKIHAKTGEIMIWSRDNVDHSENTVYKIYQKKLTEIHQYNGVELSPSRCRFSAPSPYYGDH